MFKVRTFYVFTSSQNFNDTFEWTCTSVVWTRGEETKQTKKDILCQSGRRACSPKPPKSSDRNKSFHAGDLGAIVLMFRINSFVRNRLRDFQDVRNQKSPFHNIRMVACNVQAVTALFIARQHAWEMQFCLPVSLMPVCCV